MNITKINASSGKHYGMGNLKRSDHQYQDRLYQFNYVPEELKGCVHIKTHGNDKLISEDHECFSFETDEAVEVYILYPDKQPYLPQWLEGYERMRMNVTRIDSIADNLKGYFSLYKKVFPKGKIVLYGCSPNKMLLEEWYVESNGANYCMYSVCLKPHN
ncbi:hypothetical protein [Vallitalea okinawensis]|uniref:hypothetical protein n=1 Tax=Vallitalea okinawensis TaxID=2078660 RepID=UPI000CFAA662|nr:hypothetical protein [Vallitalea okinawensis]